ncbi:MAG: Fic family protein, partial [Proteobacteria bacterium]|nr:Fic family protein [Pseudomonadota bacterium]
FIDELIEADCKLEVYVEKALHSHVSPDLFIPSFWRNEAVASAQIEGTQATLEDVIENNPDSETPIRDIKAVSNYFKTTTIGYQLLANRQFSKEIICSLHESLMKDLSTSNQTNGQIRTSQNQICRNDAKRTITYIPPKPELVPQLLNNLINYMNEKGNRYRLLVRAAIIHAQFESIHPFYDGNGRLGRMLIPLYIYNQQQIEVPIFFISESLQQEKFKYYALLNNVRQKSEWNEWIRFFLQISIRQSNKYITLLAAIEHLFKLHFNIIEKQIGANAEKLLKYLFKQPIFKAPQAAKDLSMSISTLNRYLKVLVDSQILFVDDKQRYRKYYYYDLLDIIRV